jgi:hypothetical protein
MSSQQPDPALVPGASAPKKRGKKWAEWAVLLGGIAIAVVALIYLTHNEPARAKVGDCVEQTGDDTVEVISCDDPDADFRVVARVEDQPQNAVTFNACGPHQDKGVVSAFWQGDPKGTGYVLCLGKVRP